MDLGAEDEVFFQRHGSRCPMGVPPEDRDPVSSPAPTRKHVGRYGAVRRATGELVTRAATPFNAATFAAFLRQLLRHRRPGRRLGVIVDNVRYHHARELAPWLRRPRRHFRLCCLPPYSPQLNPIQRVWKLTRRLCLHNEYFPTLELLVTRVDGQLIRWAKPNEMLRRLCAII